MRSETMALSSTTTVAKDRKRRRSTRRNKHVLNPLMRVLLRGGLFPGTYALLETVGRRSGTRRLTPVGCGRDGDTVWLVSEHGMRSDYVRNLAAEPSVRVRLGRRWHTGTAAVLPDDDPLARRVLIDRSNGLMGRLDGAIFRSNVTDGMTVRVDLEGERRTSRS
jgi:deazaflavin-dependent oxidoreductase (nitroreductase family)